MTVEGLPSELRKEVSLSVPAKDSAFPASTLSGSLNISAKLVDDFRFNTSDQAINGALKELVDEQVLGMKHTDRNRWELAPNIVFEGKKEAK